MRIAIVGSGISGMVAARELARKHDVTLFESNDYIGGHTNTVSVELDGTQYAVDTGFIVFNDWTYPNFIALLQDLGVESQPSPMSFSVSCPGTGIEYNGHSLNTLYSQRSNLFRPRFHRMLLDVLRFNREALSYLETETSEETLGEFLASRNLGGLFVSHYIVPMGAAIWSMNPALIKDFPASYFLNFFRNHGLLNIKDRPQWRVIKGGSREYVKKLTAPIKNQIRLNSPVKAILRQPQNVAVTTEQHGTEHFDHVVLACHSDQALGLLGDPGPEERAILGAIKYQENQAVLHTDCNLLPKRRRAWAAWNYLMPDNGDDRVALTYSMNILQSLEAPQQLCVTLNRGDLVDPQKILRSFTYAHPVYEPVSVTARARHDEINGLRNTWYCGAYWGYGFHEDGVKSALKVSNAIDGMLEHEQLYLSRTG